MNRYILRFCISCCLILMVGCSSYSQGRHELSRKNNSVAVETELTKAAERQKANNYGYAEKDSDGGGGGGGGG